MAVPSTTAAPTTTVVPPSTTASTTVVAPATTVAPNLVDGASSSPTAFSGMGPVTWTDGRTAMGWTDQWNGYGTARTVSDATTGGRVLSLSPAVAESPSQTHSALMTSLNNYRDPTFSVPVRTVTQLRQGSAPNDWEVGWVLWDYQSSDSFYGVLLKPTGWELIKETNGHESFIATGSTPVFPVGRWYDVSVSQQGSQISVSVDGQPLVSASDGSFQSGAIGLYCEDSVAHFGDVSVPS